MALPTSEKQPAYTKRYVDVEMTPEFKVLITKLEQARDVQRHFTFIATTGRSKSFTLGVFKRANPQHTYIITLNGHMKLKDVINALCMEIDVPVSGSEWQRLLAIMEQLRHIQTMGGKPVVVFDEAENVKAATLQFMKALYDGIKQVAGVGIVGTPQFLVLLDKLVKKNRQGVPQLASRFAANTTIMPPLKESFDIFINKYAQDPGLKELLKDIGTDYRILTDYLEPALREADKRDLPLTEDLFRTVHNMPKYIVKKAA